MKIIKKWFRLPPRKRRMLIEAYFTLAWARILKSMPFSKIAPGLGVRMEETPNEFIPEHEVTIQQVSYAIHTMSRVAFWKCQCLVRAIAASKMLERRGISSTLYLGTARDDDGRLIAHAWLRSGTIYVSGEEEMARFTAVATFAKHLHGTQAVRRVKHG